MLKTTTVHPFVHPGFRSLHNPGYDKLVPLVHELAAVEERPIVVSIAGNTPAELAFLARTFAEAGAGAIEVNFADPWVEATLAPFESEETFAAATKALATAGKAPCWVKLPERGGLPYARIVELLLDAGIRGVVAPIDFTGFEKLLLEAPHPIDVIAVGGIASGFDVVRALQKGAKAVQVGSALRAEGPGVFARLEREMRKAASERA